MAEGQRLLARVTPLRALVVWGEQWPERLREAAARGQPVVREEQEAAFRRAVELAHEVLNDRDPEAKDKRRSLVDPEVRTGKHGDYYEGYLLEVSLDADSELICAVEVLPANGAEAANAKSLIARAEAAYGNDVASLSRERIGYRGEVLAEGSEAANGPQLTGSVPPIERVLPAPDVVPPEAVTLTADRTAGRCPGGATPRTRRKREQGWRFHFCPTQCRACPLRSPCLRPDARGGRTVIKNDNEAQDRAAQQRA